MQQKPGERSTVHASSYRSSSWFTAGARFIRNRELLRLKRRSGRKPQGGRYLREKPKAFSAGRVEYVGLTDSDHERICNVIRHWAAASLFPNAQPGIPS